MNNNLNNQIFNAEREVDLKDMLYYICKRWRSSLIVTAIVMIIVLIIEIPALFTLNGVGAIIKQLVCYAIIGIIVGLVFMCIFSAILYVLNGKIKSENEFKSYCNLCVLGVLPKVDRSKINGIDRMIRRLFGVERKSKDFDKLADRMAEELKAVLAVRKTEKSVVNQVPCVAVVSTESDSTAKELTFLLEPKLKDSVRVISAGDILTRAESIQAVMKASSVIMVERIGVSEYHKVEDGIGKLVSWNKNVLGIVLIDGDTK